MRSSCVVPERTNRWIQGQDRGAERWWQDRLLGGTTCSVFHAIERYWVRYMNIIQECCSLPFSLLVREGLERSLFSDKLLSSPSRTRRNRRPLSQDTSVCEAQPVEQAGIRRLANNWDPHWLARAVLYSKSWFGLDLKVTCVCVCLCVQLASILLVEEENYLRQFKNEKAGITFVDFIKVSVWVA